MTKSELVEQMAKDAGISKSAANAALNSVILSERLIYFSLLVECGGFVFQAT